MNDPNGLAFVDGELHVTYQHNPAEARWGVMCWGHAWSRDLLTWRHLPIALSPDPAGPDAAGCWSGNVVRTEGGGGASPAVAFYTGVTIEGDLRRQVVCRAETRDLRHGTWHRSPTRAIVDRPPPGIEPDLFRDPFVARAERGWNMLVGAGTTDGHGAVLRYVSDDLVAWRFDRTILSSDQLDPAAGADAPMWECPQLLTGDAADVLIVSIVDRAPGIRPSHVTAFVGRLEPEGFAVERVQQLGMGPDFYAPAACRTPDGRWLLLGWIPEDPPEPGSDRVWAGSLTFPRIVGVLGDGSLSLSLAEEVAAARGTGTRAARRRLAPAGSPWTPAIPDGPFEARFELQAGGGAEAVLELRDDDVSPLARVTWQGVERVLTVARRGIVGVAGRSAVSSAQLPAADGDTLVLRMIVDGSILELEANGHIMATARLSPRASTVRSLVVSAVGGPVSVAALDVWPLQGPDARDPDARAPDAGDPDTRGSDARDELREAGW